MTSSNQHLFEQLRGIVEHLPGVTHQKMFGCEGFFADGRVFGLVWKEGRIGVKLTDAAVYEEAMKQPGASPWSPGGKMTMSHWVLLPESVHDDDDSLKHWAKRAHQLALAAPAKKATTKKAAAKKPAAKKPAAKKPAAKKTAARK